jgi:hypothetical protein
MFLVGIGILFELTVMADGLTIQRGKTNVKRRSIILGHGKGNGI